MPHATRLQPGEHHEMRDAGRCCECACASVLETLLEYKSCIPDLIKMEDHQAVRLNPDEERVLHEFLVYHAEAERLKKGPLNLPTVREVFVQTLTALLRTILFRRIHERALRACNLTKQYMRANGTPPRLLPGLADPLASRFGARFDVWSNS
ncbi:hypothetical protein GNI_132550 [Gregarina niphandrodes]|uniref:Uncharacterized protein n=1 Tax=Gregarina niphandrodes TaxID=110365 RepID=A0A023B198_GRENI|nr:hypothetical protein GNI_132550 [Gregarina niphandrodes]EZG46948.1 hypothetical protein GNI_132550 [Gregarina niphandrodes]|eukprot:XP_011132223.1 hypothetical protein GNI_132550 [Gregarina niphandrodes]